MWTKKGYGGHLPELCACLTLREIRPFRSHSVPSRDGRIFRLRPAGSLLFRTRREVSNGHVGINALTGNPVHRSSFIVNRGRVDGRIFRLRPAGSLLFRTRQEKRLMDMLGLTFNFQMRKHLMDISGLKSGGNEVVCPQDIHANLSGYVALSPVSAKGRTGANRLSSTHAKM
jgi:hypothetical protein